MKSKKNNKTAIRNVVFTLRNYYKDLFFNVFNITNIEKIVNVKYSTKNNKINGIAVFLAIKNQNRAIKSSIKNFRVILTRVKNGCLLTSPSCPLRKINRVITVATKKDNIRKIDS
jgi:hypothetical protein